MHRSPPLLALLPLLGFLLASPSLAAGSADPGDAPGIAPDDLQTRSGESAQATATAPRGTSVATKLGVHSEDDGLRVVTPLVSVRQRIYDTTTLGVEWDADVLTAASVDVRTAASKSFSETRHGLTFTGDHTFTGAQAAINGSLSVSHERDYQSATVSAGGSKDLFQRNLTLSGGYAYVYNRVGRSRTPFADFEEHLDIHALTLGLTQVLSRRTLLIASSSLIYAQGYQASVYRYTPVFLEGSQSASTLSEATLLDGSAKPLYRLPEQVPETRFRVAGLLRINHYLPPHTGLSLGYRLYGDSWNLLSHTIDLKVTQDLPAGLSLRLRNRVYLQRGASFYAPVYEVSDPGAPPRYLTMDRELSPFFYDLVGLKLSYRSGTIGPFSSMTLDAKVDFQLTHYADFPYLERRQALIFETGLAFEL